MSLLQVSWPLWIATKSRRSRQYRTFSPCWRYWPWLPSSSLALCGSRTETWRISTTLCKTQIIGEWGCEHSVSCGWHDLRCLRCNYVIMLTLWIWVLNQKFTNQTLSQSRTHRPGILLWPLQLRRLELPQLCDRGDQGAEQEPAQGHLRLPTYGHHHLPAGQCGLLLGADPVWDPGVQSSGCGMWNRRRYPRFQDTVSWIFQEYWCIILMVTKYCQDTWLYSRIRQDVPSAPWLIWYTDFEYTYFMQGGAGSRVFYVLGLTGRLWNIMNRFKLI